MRYAQVSGTIEFPGNAARPKEGTQLQMRVAPEGEINGAELYDVTIMSVAWVDGLWRCRIESLDRSPDDSMVRQ